MPNRCPHRRRLILLDPLRPRRAAGVFHVLALLGLIWAPGYGAPRSLKAKILRVKGDEIWVNRGMKDHLLKGKQAILRDGKRIVLVADVVGLQEKAARLVVRQTARGFEARPGQSMDVFLVPSSEALTPEKPPRPKKAAPPVPAAPPAPPVPAAVAAPVDPLPVSPAAPPTPAPEPPPVIPAASTVPGTEAPVVLGQGKAPAQGPETLTVIAPARRRRALTKSSNVFHGRLRFSEVVNRDPMGKSNYNAHRMGLTGSVERIRGSAWSLAWQGNLSYRSGPGAVNSIEYHNTKFDLYRFSLEGRFENGFVKIGRFLPLEAPSAGYLDGLQGERTLSPSWRVGNAVGLKPTRMRQDFATNELSETLYTTVERGERQRLYLQATVALHATVFKGSLDRTAAFSEIQMDLGPKLSWMASTETDFNWGGSRPWSGARWTRVTSSAWAPLTSFLTLRAGADHFEQTYSDAERAAFSIPDDQTLDPGYWRYYGGATQSLFWHWQADGEVSFSVVPGQAAPGRWRGGLTHTGLPWCPMGRFSTYAYDLTDVNASNVGNQNTLYVPFLQGQWGLNLSMNGRTFHTNDPLNLGTFGPSRGYKVTDYSIQADGMFSRSWSFFLSYTHTFAVFKIDDLFNAGLNYRW